MPDYLNLLNIKQEQFEPLFQEFILEHNLTDNNLLRILFAKSLIVERAQLIHEELQELVEWIEEN